MSFSDCGWTISGHKKVRARQRTKRLLLERLEDRQLLTTLTSVADGCVYPTPIVVEGQFTGDGPLATCTEIFTSGHAWIGLHPLWNKNRGIAEFDIGQVVLPANPRATLHLGDVGGWGSDTGLATNLIDINGYIGDGALTTDDYAAPLHNGLAIQIVTDAASHGFEPRYHVDVTDFVVALVQSSEEFLGFRFEAGSAMTFESFGFVATLTIEEAPNSAPAAADISASLNEDVSVGVELLGSDLEGDSLTYTIVTAPQHGTLVGTAPNLTYRPAEHFHGTDSFTYRVNDSAFDSNLATVTLTVAPVNDAPRAVSIGTNTLEDVTKAFSLIGTDVDDDPLTYTIVTFPDYGTLTGTAPNLIYTPPADFTGTVFFTYQVSDGEFTSNPSLVDIRVLAINDAPLSIDDAFTVSEDATLVQPAAAGVLANDLDVDGEALTALLKTEPAHGDLTFHADGSFAYVPDPNYFGQDSFTYISRDPFTFGTIATALIDVLPVNDAPTADAGGPYETLEGGAVTLIGAGQDVDDTKLLYGWDLDGDGDFDDGTNPITLFSTAGLEDGNYSPRLRVTDPQGASIVRAAKLFIVNAPPTAMFAVRSATELGATLEFSDSQDGSAIDAKGLQYSYDLNADGVWDVGDGSYGGSVRVLAASTGILAPGVHQARGRILDQDGGFTDYTVAFEVTDDDDERPTIVLGGSEGAQNDGLGQRFTWDVQDASGLSTAVEVTRDSGSGPTVVFQSLERSGVFDFNALGLGTFAILVDAADNDDDRPGDSLSATSSRSVVVTDDDPVPPGIILSGSTGVEVTSQSQRFRWSIQDDDGASLRSISGLEITITRDAGSGPQTIFHTTDTARWLETFDFNSFGLGIYELSARVTESDNDWLGDQQSHFATRRVDVRDVAGILWVNRGVDSDGITAVFGANAPAVRAAIDAAIDSWNEVVTSFNYSDGSRGFGLSVFMSPGNEPLGGTSDNSNIYLDANGVPRFGAISFGVGTDGHGAGWWIDPTPGDSAEFDNPTTPFAAVALAGSPAFGARDLYTTALHEIGHSLGINSYYLEQAAAHGRLDLIDTGTNVFGERLYAIEGGDYRVSFRGGHVAHPFAENTYTGPSGVTYAGADDLLNPTRPNGWRRSISNLDALLLQDAFGHSMTMPETLGNFYANLNESTGVLTIKGISPFTGPTLTPEPSSDVVFVHREGDELVVSIDLGADIRGVTRMPGGSPFDPYISRFPADAIRSIQVLPGDGDDRIVLDGWAGSILIDGQAGSDDTRIALAGLPGGSVSVRDSGTSGSDSLLVYGTADAETIEKNAGVVSWNSLLNTVDFSAIESVIVDAGAGNDLIVDPGENTTLLGGLGDDTIIVNATTGSGVLVDGGEGSDSYVIGGGTLEGPVTVTDSGAAGSDGLTVLGTAGDDQLTQTSTGYVLNGGAITFGGGLESAAVDGGGGSDQLVTEGTPPVPFTVAAVGQMVVNGTDGDDHISFAAGSEPGQIVAQLNGALVAAFAPTTGLVARGLAGDDDIQVAGGIALSAWLYGGLGNDRLKGGGGHDALFGGEEDDLLVGGSGRDLLVGGNGSDRIVGNADDDILIAGKTGFDFDPAAIAAIMAEWTSSRSYIERTQNLLGTTSGTTYDQRLNGNYFLSTEGSAPTVLDDGASDILTGSAGQDWFFAQLDGDATQLKDKIADLSAAEFQADLDFILS